MADILSENSTYASGTNDTATTAVDLSTLHAASNINGALSAAVQIESILGNGLSLRGSATDLVTRLAVGIDGAGVLLVNNATAFPGPLDIARGGTGQATALIVAGDILLFQQTTAPVSWTKLTSLNDYALRVVTGTASTGGSNGFSAVFPQATTGAHQLTVAQMPAHTHTAVATVSAIVSETGSPQVSHATSTQTNPATSSTGGDGTHTHALVMDINFIDVILASKDS